MSARRPVGSEVLGQSAWAVGTALVLGVMKCHPLSPTPKQFLCSSGLDLLTLLRHKHKRITKAKYLPIKF